MVKIISDSTCDLSPELVNRYDIDILPLHILLGEKEYKDGKNITPDEIFAWSDAHKTTPKTSAPSLVDAIEILKPYVEEKREVICFSISSSMSTSGNVMRLAADELEASDFVTVIDYGCARGSEAKSACKLCGRHFDVFVSWGTL